MTYSECLRAVARTESAIGSTRSSIPKKRRNIKHESGVHERGPRRTSRGNDLRRERCTRYDAPIFVASDEAGSTRESIGCRRGRHFRSLSQQQKRYGDDEKRREQKDRTEAKTNEVVNRLTQFGATNFLLKSKNESCDSARLIGDSAPVERQ